ncbi:MAG TPA: dUTP diphosphatase [Candidatus Dojkabacteria bacterium]|jgi:NTP pyrophosphatase (non-canonical NTP hydrolase)|nr:dUTP diphosphatase [Candidatus Dojkabacteria bacterium]
MKKCLNDYIQEVANFAEVRGWENEDPNELLTSTVIELGELAEHYQWQKEFKKKYTEREKKEIGYEFVDVFFYLFRIIGHTGIDMDKIFDEKYKKLEKKFYIGANSRKQHEIYRKSGKNKLYD